MNKDLLNKIKQAHISSYKDFYEKTDDFIKKNNINYLLEDVIRTIFYNLEQKELNKLSEYKSQENNITYDVKEDTLGNQFYFLNGTLHRETYPAIIHAGSKKVYINNGKVHRTDGSEEYYYNGNYLPDVKTNKQLKKYIKLLSIS